MLHHLMFDVSLKFQVHDYDEKAKISPIEKKQTNHLIKIFT